MIRYAVLTVALTLCVAAPALADARGFVKAGDKNRDGFVDCDAVIGDLHTKTFI